MSDFLSMFNYTGKTAKVLGKSKVNTYKDIYLHLTKKQTENELINNPMLSVYDSFTEADKKL